jgi:hypothetical protein
MAEQGGRNDALGHRRDALALSFVPVLSRKSGEGARPTVRPLVTGRDGPQAGLSIASTGSSLNMRTFRWLAAACAVAMLPAATAAQTFRAFDNSWFWGAKAGVASFETSVSGNKVAPLVGGEWLITRTRFGLYIAGDQAFFTEESGIDDGMGGQYQVSIKNLRRFTAAGLFFPKALTAVRPYAGAGFAINWIGDASAGDVFTSPEEAAFVNFEVDRQQDRASFVFVLGVQGIVGRFAPFGQVTLQPSHTGFLLNERAVYLLEGGFRINAGSSRER